MAEPSEPTLKELSGRIGKYEIVRLLGKGAMGQVYLARDTDLDRDVALKVMAAQIADDPELKRRFEHEARAVAKMKHRNVVMVFDRGTHTDGSPYIAMEYLEGQDLHKAMRQIPPLTLEEKVTIIVQVLAGLAHAHDKGIFHRDIKPANIFIQEDGSVKIMDFGVAHVSAASMTGTGNVMGTADYMSPEQVKGEKKIDGRSDLFSVGCMLFELAAGRRPFHSDNLMAIFYKITHEDANLDLIPQGADYDALMPILKKALARNVEDRYQTAYEFAMDLREWLRAHATTASSQNVLEALVDLEAPTHAPPPATGAPGVTFVPERATVDLGRRGPRQAPTAPTHAGGRTAVDAGPGTTRRPGTTRVGAPPSPRVPARPAAAKPGVLPWAAVVLVLGAAGVGGWLFWKNQRAPATPPVTQAAATPTPVPPSPTPAPTPTPPPVTAAPAPKFEEAAGRAAAQIRGAQAAFKAGSYDRAVAAAQEALREDPANANALQVLRNAQDGQKALLQLRAAEAALARGDFDAAETEIEEARRLAPWEASVVEFSPRVAEARARARRDAEARAVSARTVEINSALDKAATALQNKQYEAAIAAYDQILATDPANAAAAQGKQAAIGAKAIADAAASGAKPGGVRTFVAGRTEAKGIEQGGLVGFEESAGVQVKRGTQAAELPGRIVFETSPVAPKPGERFRVSVSLSNEGPQAIPLAALTVATTVDGKPQRGPVPLLTTTVAPFQRALVFQTPGDQVWREGTQSWVMEVVLRTAKGETYRSTLSWK